ncbi:MAG: HD domain-containing protein [Sulfitobacter sp.]
MTQDIAFRFAPHQQLATDLLRNGAPDAGDGAHDLSHVLRVWQNVQSIMAEEGGDPGLLVAATILHDGVNLPKDHPDRSKASQLSANRAESVLASLAWQQAAIDGVSHAIAAHSFSAGITPRTLEAKILQDADRLDAIGHIGIARCFVVSGQLGRLIYDVDDPSAQSRTLDDGRFALDHFYTKLLRLAEGFQTRTGQRLAAERHAVMLSFIEGLLAEISL